MVVLMLIVFRVVLYVVKCGPLNSSAFLMPWMPFSISCRSCAGSPWKRRRCPCATLCDRLALLVIGGVVGWASGWSAGFVIFAACVFLHCSVLVGNYFSRCGLVGASRLLLLSVVLSFSDGSGRLSRLVRRLLVVEWGRR